MHLTGCGDSSGFRSQLNAYAIPSAADDMRGLVAAGAERSEEAGRCERAHAQLGEAGHTLE
jgi:hypothetical protein